METGSSTKRRRGRKRKLTEEEADTSGKREGGGNVRKRRRTELDCADTHQSISGSSVVSVVETGSSSVKRRGRKRKQMELMEMEVPMVEKRRRRRKRTVVMEVESGSSVKTRGRKSDSMEIMEVQTAGGGDYGRRTELDCATSGSSCVMSVAEIGGRGKREGGGNVQKRRRTELDCADPHQSTCGSSVMSGVKTGGSVKRRGRKSDLMEIETAGGDNERRTELDCATSGSSCVRSVVEIGRGKREGGSDVQKTIKLDCADEEHQGTSGSSSSNKVCVMSVRLCGGVSNNLLSFLFSFSP